MLNQDIFVYKGDKMNSETDKRQKDSRKSQNIAVPNFIYNKFTKHIRILKNLESRSTTNQTWITNAIKKKIEQNEKLLKSEIPQKRMINVKIDPNSYEKISEQVEEFKKHTGSYSKTKWILEAIMDQLEEESTKVKDLLKK